MNSQNRKSIESSRHAHDRRQKTINGKVVSEVWLVRRRLIFPCIGYYTEPKHRGKGYASELASSLLNNKRIVFGGAHSSESKHMLKKLGFRRIGLEKWVRIMGVMRIWNNDRELFSIIGVLIFMITLTSILTMVGGK